MFPVSIHPGLKAAAPTLALGLVHASVRVEMYNHALWGEIHSRIKEIASQFDIDQLQDVPEIVALRNAYRALGKDPARYRGSAEALSRRIIQGKTIDPINTVVDINNLVSLECMHPVGSYNLAHLRAPVVFRIGEQGETYKAIGKDSMNMADLPLFADAFGPFGSPTSDSERAMIGLDTTDLMTIIISFTGPDALDTHLNRLTELLVRYAHAPNERIERMIVK